MPERSRLVVLASGRGTNFEALQRAVLDGRLKAEISAVISDRAEAGVLRLAEEHGRDTVVLEPGHFDSRERFERALAAAIDGFAPRYVVLAGFMRILGDELVRRYAGRMVNIHPSLLPRHRGLHTHRRVLEAGETEHGASVHFVIPALDAGPVISRVRMPVEVGDTADTLAARLLELEHRLYPATLALLLNHRVELRDEEICIDDQAMDAAFELGRDLDDDGDLVNRRDGHG